MWGRKKRLKKERRRIFQAMSDAQQELICRINEKTKQDERDLKLQDILKSLHENHVNDMKKESKRELDDIKLRIAKLENWEIFEGDEI